MSTDTVFRIASMVKLLTSVAAMQLVERGKLKLDEPAARIDPMLAAPHDSHRLRCARRAATARGAKAITLRNLLTHTSGFSYPLWDANVFAISRLRAARQDFPRMPLMFEPGTRWAYGGSLDRVSRMVEIASGQGHRPLFPRQHHRPARHERHRLHRSPRSSVRGRRGCIGAAPTASWCRSRSRSWRRRQSFSGGGGIYSTAPDYLTAAAGAAQWRKP